MPRDEALKALERARKQCDRVNEASWDPQEPELAVTWAFYAYENGITAVAEALMIPWQKTHPSKVALARKLFQDKVLLVDIADLLQSLNDLRKDVQYGDPGRDLSEVDLEDLATQLEVFLDEVERIVSPSK